jgi:hypothetical protein
MHNFWIFAPGSLVYSPLPDGRDVCSANGGVQALAWDIAPGLWKSENVSTESTVHFRVSSMQEYL